MYQHFCVVLFFVFVFAASQCPVLHVASNVQVIGNPNEAIYGNVVRFSCKSNDEILKGAAEIYCNEEGFWVGEVPTCKGTECQQYNTISS